MEEYAKAVQMLLQSTFWKIAIGLWISGYWVSLLSKIYNLPLERKLQKLELQKLKNDVKIGTDFPEIVRSVRIYRA